MELYIIRHGQSTNNVTMMADASIRDVDPPLTELGRQQAEAVAYFLRTGETITGYAEALPDTLTEDRHGFGVTRLYCSPMLRALQTCQPISRALGLKPQVWIEIHEHGGMYLDYRDERGIVGFPGLTRAEILAQFEDYTLPETVTEQGWWNPTSGQEDISGAQARALKVAAALRARAETDERIALVTHGTFADALLKAFFAQLPAGQHYFYHNNTGITRLDFPDQRRVYVRYVNRVDHLTPELVS